MSPCQSEVLHDGLNIIETLVYCVVPIVLAIKFLMLSRWLPQSAKNNDYIEENTQKTLHH